MDLKEYGQAVIAVLEKDTRLGDAVIFYQPPKDWLSDFLFTEIAIAFHANLSPAEAREQIYKEFVAIGEEVRKPSKA